LLACLQLTATPGSTGDDACCDRCVFAASGAGPFMQETKLPGHTSKGLSWTVHPKDDHAVRALRVAVLQVREQAGQFRFGCSIRNALPCTAPPPWLNHLSSCWIWPLSLPRY
jgi:hypothetical protein